MEELLFKALSDRVSRLIEVYKLGLSPDDSIELLLKEGWSRFEIFEAVVIMTKTLEDKEKPA